MRWLLVIPLLLPGCTDADPSDGEGEASTGSSLPDAATTSSSTTASTPSTNPPSTSTNSATEDPETSGSSGGTGATSTGTTTGDAGTFVCTHVIGYSQVNEWFNGGGVFESVVDDDAWQLRWNGGAAVDLWADPNYEGWDRPIESACAKGSDAPDRVLLSISGGFGDDEVGWAGAIEDAIATIRDKHPSVTRIVLQPVVGGPDHATCMFGGQDIRASWQHAHIDNAIANVVGDDVVAGFSPEVSDCAEYEDALGHLTDEGAELAGQAIGEHYGS